MSEARAIYAIWLRDIKRLWLDRARILIGLLQPALYLFVLGSGLGSVTRIAGGKGDYIQFIFPGVIGLTVLFTAVFSAVSIVFDREFGFLKEVLVAPVSRRAIAIGKSLSGSTQATVQGILILIFAPLAGVHFGFGELLGLIVIMALTGFAMTSFGVLFAARFRSTEAFPIVINGILLPLFFLSGALYPVTNLPVWLTPFVHIDPLTYGIDAMRGAALPKGLEVGPGVFVPAHVYPIWLSVAVIVAFGLVMVWLAVWQFSRAE